MNAPETYPPFSGDDPTGPKCGREGEADVPVGLRVGTTREHMIGTVTINLTTDADGVERASVDGAALAGLLREAADEFEADENGTDS